MFREKYRRDNELIKAPEMTQEDIVKMIKNTGRTRRVSVRQSVIAAACLMIAAVAAATVVLGGIDRTQTKPVEETVSMGDMSYAADYSEIYDIITELRSQNGGYDMYYFSGLGLGAVVEDGAGRFDDSLVMNETNESLKESVTAPTTAKPSADADYSETNTQVKGVDEADIMKTDGRYIYRLTGNKIVIIDPQAMTVVSQIEPDPLTDADRAAESELRIDEKDYSPECSFWINNMYLCGDRLAVLFNKHVPTEARWQFKVSGGIVIYDISDRSTPQQVACLSQDGSLVSSRMIDGNVYLISSYSVPNEEIIEEQPETFVPGIDENGVCKPIGSHDICITAEPDSAQYVVMSSVNVDSCEKFSSVEATFGCAPAVYADTETILLSYTKNVIEKEETQKDGENVTVNTRVQECHIIRFMIDNGEITPAGDCIVPGSLLNQFSIDRYNGIIRVVTTTSSWKQTIYTDGVDRYEFEDYTANGVYTIDENLDVIGRLDGLAEGEQVYSVRFIGDIGYFVTFRQVDPLFAVDLSNPSSPVILSELKIPGFSQYMHPYGDGLLFGFGRDADEATGWAGGLKLSMFDISDPANVTEKHKLIFDTIYWSDALYDHKAIMVYADRNIIAFPTNGGYIVCGYGDEGFYKRFELELNDNYYHSAQRGMFIGDSFYICSDILLSRFDIESFEKTGELVINDAKDSGFIMYD